VSRKIFRSIFWTSILVLFVTIGLIFGILYDYMGNVSNKQLISQLNLAVQGVEDNGTDYLDSVRKDDLRITWIDSDGTVLYDSVSDPRTMSNHKNREEVKEALNSVSGYGESTRYSNTLTERMLYAAKRLSDGTVLRVSITQNSVLTILLGMIQPAVVILILLGIFALFLSSRLAKKIVQPLNQLDLEHPLENEKYDELSPLLRRIASQQAELRDKELDLKQKQRELDTILGNMSEGMIILRRDGRVVSLNQAAKEILDIQDYKDGENLLQICRNLDLVNLIESAMEGTEAERLLNIHERNYQINVAPITRDGDSAVIGVAVMMYDVTDREMAESMRREFTANVSHELKTPLHAISGYAELMMNRMIDEDAVPDCAGRIYQETQRMIRLVQDIISLSHLDEGAGDIDWEETDLYDLAKTSVEQYVEEAGKKGIGLHLSGEKAVLRGKKPLLQTMVSNLIDNAIKYTQEGGKVHVDVKADDKDICLTVEDNGIGIPEADQKRIFERFYRVDKSHSKEIGGTGLGLSIVKHAVMIHGGKIDVQSRPGEGSTFIVTLPKHV
jgi:two-component system phosphate regulon sensor histidine kinase PhoR